MKHVLIWDCDESISHVLIRKLAEKNISSAPYNIYGGYSAGWFKSGLPFLRDLILVAVLKSDFECGKFDSS